MAPKKMTPVGFEPTPPYGDEKPTARNARDSLSRARCVRASGPSRHEQGPSAARLGTTPERGNKNAEPTRARVWHTAAMAPAVALAIGPAPTAAKDKARRGGPTVARGLRNGATLFLRAL
ncbi:hypothetical protein HETIRDRAFT_108402 [Heterobasidion irregulare TC 32-1]|uniref:Uncharacterized protein n=1 Tax=Heterobasidion irregulare (strain TC 32-1) TaxID=747525 RepID=W4JN01_HETIT|nr:uncharacterized protein HETIRDRAFT_108402 [Heterobasidion irregulare TC 32-1]ETW74913.1 hypothetical protein HETIRDRAFT_108402 [Heterobasidion irregulare TC 32-1]